MKSPRNIHRNFAEIGNRVLIGGEHDAHGGGARVSRVKGTSRRNRRRNRPAARAKREKREYAITPMLRVSRIINLPAKRLVPRRVAATGVRSMSVLSRTQQPLHTRFEGFGCGLLEFCVEIFRPTKGASVAARLGSVGKKIPPVIAKVEKDEDYELHTYISQFHDEDVRRRENNVSVAARLGSR